MEHIVGVVQFIFTDNKCLECNVMPKENNQVIKITNNVIGFVGLGKMGGGMVRNLISKGVQVAVFDKNRESQILSQKVGAQVFDSLAELVQAVSIVFLCLPFKPEIDDVLFGENGIVSASKKNILIVDTSTIYFNDAQDFQEKLLKYDIRYVDCPISGLPKRAKNGSLTMMFGGSVSDYNLVCPYLKLMGSFIIHCGDCGTGQLMKAFNNALYNINIAAMSEMLPLAVKAGLNSNHIAKMFMSGSSRSFASEHFLPKIMEGEFKGDYSMGDAYKDIENVKRAIQNVSLELPLFDGMVKVYKESLDQGYEQHSKSAMLKVYEKKLGIKLK